MRIVVATLALSLIGLQVQAQTAPPPSAPAAPAAAAAPAVAAPAAPATSHKRMTFKQRFAAANTSHDGHLTKAQAADAKMTFTVKHFDDIDTAKKGYVTADEIDSFAKAQRATRKATATPKTTTPKT